jgi:hypothetical protein
MAFGRLSADAAAARFGASTLGRAGALVAAAGLGGGLILGSAGGAIAGFAVMGIGLAPVFPLAVRAVGYDPSISGPAVAAVSSVGYAGFLTGPPAIGGLAESVGLGGALACVCALLVVAAALAGHLSTRIRAVA